MPRKEIGKNEEAIEYMQNLIEHYNSSKNNKTVVHFVKQLNQLIKFLKRKDIMLTAIHPDEQRRK